MTLLFEQAVAKNILALLQAGAGKPYKSHGTMLVLTLGSKDGVLQSPMGVMGGNVVSSAKGKSLFVGKLWKQFNLTPPPLPSA